LDKVDKSGLAHPSEPEKGRCWLWTGATIGGTKRSTQGDQYGSIHHYDADGRERSKRTHRVMYEHHHHVELTPEQLVLHSCDNSLCCNPDHLGLGTHADNMREMAQRGRATGGRHIPPAKREQAIRLLNDGTARAEITKQTGISRSTIKRLSKRLRQQPSPAAPERCLEQPDLFNDTTITTIH